MKPITVLLVDDQRSVRDALRMVLTVQPDISVIGEAGDGLSAISVASALQPDVVVMDYEMPGMDGVEATQLLANARDAPRIVILTLHDSPAVRSAAADAGAFAFVAKHEPTEVLLTAIRTAAAGD